MLLNFFAPPKRLRFTLWLLAPIAGIFMLLSLSLSANAGAVYSCSQKQTKCVVKLDSGQKDYPLKIYDEKARLVATGVIVRRKGAYGLVKISQIFKDIRKGYPVILDIENEKSQAQWTSMTPYVPSK